MHLHHVKQEVPLARMEVIKKNSDNRLEQIAADN